MDGRGMAAAAEEEEEREAGRVTVVLAIGSISISSCPIADAVAVVAAAGLRGIPAAPYLDGYGSVRNGFTMGIVIHISQYP